MTNTWLITGGSSGLGLSLGRVVLARGGKVVLTTRNIAKAQAAAPDVEEKGGKWLQLDFGDADLEKNIQDAVRGSNVDVIVNNAGYPLIGPVEECSPDLIRAQYEANLIGPIRIIQAALPIFREHKAGTIINIGSSVSHIGRPALALYGSTKSAIRTMTEGLAPEVAHFGVRVILFEPGQFRTNFGRNDGVMGHPPRGYSDAYNDSAVSNLLGNLTSHGPSPGNPDEGAARIYEVVTGTGMATDPALKEQVRFFLGSDSHGSAEGTSKEWADLARAGKSIACSTDFDD